MENPEKLATLSIQDDEKHNKNTTEYVWTPLYTSKHK